MAPVGDNNQPTTVNVDIEIPITEKGHPTTPMIEKVPEILRENEKNENCFTPLLMALGPHHHGKQEHNLKRGEELKIQLVRKFYKDGKKSCYDEDYGNVAAVAASARECYPKDSTAGIISDDDFAKMMFDDGCCLLQFISTHVNGKWDEAAVNIKNHEKTIIIRDLFLLENQLPFVVLEQLMPKEEIINNFERFIKDIRLVPVSEPSWPAKLAEFFYNFHRRWSKGEQNRKQPNEEVGEGNINVKQERPLHLLDSLWKYYVGEDEYKATMRQASKYKSTHDWHTFRSAHELKAAGIIFCPSKTFRFTDVSYMPLHVLHISYLWLPPILVDDSTKCLLLNLASFEMSSTSPNEYPVSSYIHFLGSLIDHGQDVAQLRRSGILRNRLRTDDQVVEIFKDIAKDLMSDANAFRYVRMHIDKHYRSNIRRKLTEWLFFNFRIMSFIPAILGLGLTITQTYVSVQQFVKPAGTGTKY